MLKFASNLKKRVENKEAINFSALTTYILPIVSAFLFHEEYRKHNNLVDAAIETLGCIALALPWSHYEPLLRKYLQMLPKDRDNHKTVVKIIVSLLNAFHFETSSKQPSTANSMEHSGLKEGDKSTEETAVQQSTSTKESFKIYTHVTSKILPLLHKSLMKKSKGEDEHKLAGKKSPEEEAILRVPIALAMVKLLQILPNNILEKNLTGLFLRMCTLLKTKLESIRVTARETIVKIMESLGPKYFRCLLTEMSGIMKRGYELHVMIFTISAVLNKLADQMKPGDLNSSAVDLTQMCMTELFGDVSEEKEVAQIVSKLKEAKGVKSYTIFNIISKCISQEYILQIVQPLKEQLQKKHSHKVMRKVGECLRNIALGLAENSSISEQDQLVFMHAVITESIPGLHSKKENEVSKKPYKIERPDSYLIPKEPGRGGPPAKINVRTTDHVFVEFGLELLQFSLKRDRLDKNDKKVQQMLDPFVPLLIECLHSKHIKIISLSLRCLLPLYKFPLPSFKTVTKKVFESLFAIVDKYSAVGMGKGENFVMIQMSFKLITALVRDTSYCDLKEDQLKSLLRYVEQDIQDYTRQATGFTLLKAILSKKLQSPELRDIMCKIGETAITSDHDHIRAQCRQVCLQYLLDYPLGNKLEKTVLFFASQLEYELEPGRVSALEMINMMIQSFPTDVLKRYSANLMMPLAARLVNDESHSCRKMVAQCIKKLLIKVEHDERQTLYIVPFKWLECKKVSFKRLGAQILGLYAEVEGERFEHRLHEVLPAITELIRTTKADKELSPADERSTDHFLYHVLNSLTKMLSHCPIIKKKEFAESLNNMWGELMGLILYPHVWVRLSAAQLFGLLLSSYTVEEIEVEILKKKKDKSVFLNSRQKLRDLSADFCTQLQSPYLNQQLGEQVVRNLVYLSRVISLVPSSRDEQEEGSADVTLEWMVRRLCREAKREVGREEGGTLRRRCVFTFMAALAHQLGKERIAPLLNTLLRPLCREMMDGSKKADTDLKKHSQEVLDLIKGVIGVEEFSQVYSEVQKFLVKKKAKRKQEKALEAVTNPQIYALKRIKKQLNKKDAKKRKIMKIKGKKKVPTKTKKGKFSDFVIASES